MINCWKLWDPFRKLPKYKYSKLTWKTWLWRNQNYLQNSTSIPHAIKLTFWFMNTTWLTPTPDISISLSDRVPLMLWWLILFLRLYSSSPRFSELTLIRVLASDISDSMLQRLSKLMSVIISLFLTICLITSSWVGESGSFVELVTIISHWCPV